MFFSAVSPEGSIRIFPPLINAEVNTSVITTCTAEGGPDNQFSWSLSEGDGITIQEGPVLIIDVDSVYAGGVYICFVENDAGNGEANMTVYGKEKHSPNTSCCHHFIF